jgi:hypothetical protein
MSIRSLLHPGKAVFELPLTFLHTTYRDVLSHNNSITQSGTHNAVTRSGSLNSLVATPPPSLSHRVHYPMRRLSSSWQAQAPARGAPRPRLLGSITARCSRPLSMVQCSRVKGLTLSSPCSSSTPSTSCKIVPYPRHQNFSYSLAVLLPFAPARGH